MGTDMGIRIDIGDTSDMPEELRQGHGQLISDTLEQVQAAATEFVAMLVDAQIRCAACATLERHCDACLHLLTRIIERSLEADALRLRLLRLTNETEKWRQEHRKKTGGFDA